ncbi:hypothetical protein EPO04_02405 [Patescibacteria group bacterium]|nr:MAG: hypothetical protein EPO04_02405 [Patescibacteria group bacterium]
MFIVATGFESYSDESSIASNGDSIGAQPDPLAQPPGDDWLHQLWYNVADVLHWVYTQIATHEAAFMMTAVAVTVVFLGLFSVIPFRRNQHHA